MKKQIILSVALATILFSCGQNRKENAQTKSAQLETGKAVLEEISFELESIPEEFDLKLEDINRSQIEFKEFNISQEKQSLGLPSDFVNRDFLYNSVGYKDKLDYLVGMVVKKQKVNGVDKYTVVLDFKVDSAKVNARVPAQGILIEKKYDAKIGAGIQYLIASAEMERNSAFQILIADVSEITIADKSINKEALYNTYNNDSELDNYFIIRGAVTTSILYKKFTKMSAKSEFNAAAIKVGASYYSENSDLNQDWKIGLQLTPVKEFIKGYKPKTKPNI